MALTARRVRALSVAATVAALGFGAAFAGTLDKVSQDKTIRLAVRADAPPFSYKDANGDPAGFMVDLCRAVATGLATQLHLGRAQGRVRSGHGGEPLRRH